MSLTAPKEPLFFKRITKSTVWGGDRLAGMLGFELADGTAAGSSHGGESQATAVQPIGETWELSDYPGMETPVRGGAFDGQSLQQLLAEFPDEVLGESRPDPKGRFPLLVKFIDARADLSVQIHPPDGPLSPTCVGKTEAWYILDSTESGDCSGSVIVGLKPGTTPENLQADAADKRVLNHLQELSVFSGDCLMIPAGTTHAIRSGVLLCEVQQTSDVTFRMYDWDRNGSDGKPRETHIPEALAVVDYEAPTPKPTRAEFPPVPEDGSTLTVEVSSLANCEYFRLHLVRVYSQADHHPHGFARVVTVLKGGGVIHSEFGGERPLAMGDVFLIPARMGEFTVTPGPKGLELLEAVAL